MPNPDTTSVATIPNAANVPEPGTPPKHHEKPNNLAGDKELCDQVRQWFAYRKRHYEDQPARKRMMDGGGIMDKADRMVHVALNRDTASDQHENTDSNVTSTMIFRQIRTITAGETMMFFQGDDLPAEFVPEINTTEYTRQDGLRIAQHQNMLEEYTFDEDKRRPKIKESLWYNNEYASEVVSIEWLYLKEKCTERVATAFYEDGRPKTYEFQEKERVIADWPVYLRHDLKDCYFDAQLDDETKWRCFIKAGQDSWETLLGRQESGEYMNVGKINKSHFYSGDEDEEDVKKQRMTNAGEDTELDKTGLIRTWHGWGMMPIKEKVYSGSATGKGKWDDKGTPSQMYWAVFAGNIESENAVCLKLVKNPYHHKRHPYKLLHSHPDDKGAYHRGFVSMLESLYWQATTNINQAIDNVTLKNRAPWVLEGELRTRDITSRANKIIKIARGSKLEQQAVQDSTGITMDMHDRIERDGDKTTGADKPILGEALGSRTSATEAKQVLDQSLLPLDAKASYVADQLFPWMYEMDAALWRQYGNPDTVITITHQGQLVDIRPTELYGPVKTKVTAVNRFKNNVMRRQEMNSFVQNVMPWAGPIMGQEGQKAFLRDLFKEFGYEHSSEYVPPNADYDATSRAINAVYLMTTLKQWVEPQADENQRAWLAVLEQATAEYARLPDADKDAEVLRSLQAHIQIRKNFVAQAENQMKQLMAGQQPQQGLPGEIAGNQIEAQEGATANV